MSDAHFSLLAARSGGRNHKRMATGFLIPLLALLSAAAAFAQDALLYTTPNPADPGGLTGTFDRPLLRGFAMEHDHVRVFIANLSDDKKTFRFDHLPVGKYDLVLLTPDGNIFEGLQLGAPADSLSETSMNNLNERIKKADAFFNRLEVHRIGLLEDHAYAFVERFRDRTTLTQAGEVMTTNIRRLEVIDLQQAQDDWQMLETRHLYREGEPRHDNTPFFNDHFMPQLGNIRVVDSVKNLGSLFPPPQ